MLFLFSLLLMTVFPSAEGHSLTWRIPTDGSLSLTDVNMEGHNNLTVTIFTPVDRNFSIYEVSTSNVMHPDQATALAAANLSGCDGAHDMGDGWMAGKVMGTCKDISNWANCKLGTSPLLVTQFAGNGSKAYISRPLGTYYFIDPDYCKNGTKVKIIFSATPSPSPSPVPVKDASSSALPAPSMPAGIALLVALMASVLAVL